MSTLFDKIWANHEVAQAELHRLAQRADAGADVDRGLHLIEGRHTSVRYHVHG